MLPRRHQGTHHSSKLGNAVPAVDIGADHTIKEGNLPFPGGLLHRVRALYVVTNEGSYVLGTTLPRHHEAHITPTDCVGIVEEEGSLVVGGRCVPLIESKKQCNAGGGAGQRGEEGLERLGSPAVDKEILVGLPLSTSLPTNIGHMEGVSVQG